MDDSFLSSVTQDWNYISPVSLPIWPQFGKEDESQPQNEVIISAQSHIHCPLQRDPKSLGTRSEMSDGELTSFFFKT